MQYQNLSVWQVVFWCCCWSCWGKDSLGIQCRELSCCLLITLNKPGLHFHDGQLNLKSCSGCHRRSLLLISFAPKLGSSYISATLIHLCAQLLSDHLKFADYLMHAVNSRKNEMCHNHVLIISFLPFIKIDISSLSLCSSILMSYVLASRSRLRRTGRRHLWPLKGIRASADEMEKNSACSHCCLAPSSFMWDEETVNIHWSFSKNQRRFFLLQKGSLLPTESWSADASHLIPLQPNRFGAVFKDEWRRTCPHV